MRINDKDKQMEIESRDINYILPAYLRSYLFFTKNVMPERIIFPMFPSVKIDGLDIPIEYLPHIDPIVAEITTDGSNVAEVTAQQEAELDDKDEEIKRLKSELAELKPPASTEWGGEALGGKGSAVKEASFVKLKPATKSKAKSAFADAVGNSVHKVERARYEAEDKRLKKIASSISKPELPARKPKLPPGGDIGAGLPLSDMHARDARAEKQMKRDLMSEPDINEAEEKLYEKEIARDEQGRPLIND